MIKKSIIFNSLIFLNAISGLFHASLSQGVAKGPMRDITAKELVWDMKIGWNLGNTLDAPNGETTWGNPMTTQAMMDAVKAKGFRTVRIPVTWDKHMAGPPDYTVDKAWMDRVETVVGYVLRDSMYAIVNTHHDEWITLTSTNQATVKEKITRLWTQIAARFRDYSDYLLFETFNEPRQSVNEWNGGTPEARAILNSYHQAAVNAIRATGGNNTKRFIMICGHGATPTTECIKDIVIPNDNDPRCIVSLHTYYPQDFCFEGGRSTWGSSEDQMNVLKELNREIIDVSTKGGGAAIIGEWGSIDKNNLSSRVAHAEFYARNARSKGMLPIWWDNGAKDFGLLNRKTNPPSWVWPTIVEALVKGAEDASNPLTSTVKPALAPGSGSPIVIKKHEGANIRILYEPSFISLRLFTLQGRIIHTHIQSYNSLVILTQPGLSVGGGSYLIEHKTGDSYQVNTISHVR